VYVYGGDPSVTVSQVSSSGNISSGMNDTRLQAGASVTRVDRFATESETGEPSTVTVTYDRISQTVASLSTPTDTNAKLYPVYYDGSGTIQAMTATDLYDTFITQAIDTLVDGNDRDGTFRIHTATSLSGHTLISSTAVFTDTRANTGAYSAGSIPETQDQPTTISNYYLMRTDQGSAPSHTMPLQVDGDNNLQEYSSGDFDTMLLNEVKHHAANTTGAKIRYNIDGSGNNRGSGMVNTILNGSGNRQTRFVNTNDYRAQEFPNGSATTANTYRLKINRE
tara:strand:- start:187 stop:1026 length:840 start_codon:yes stop_codon:yes gene_type:complete